MEEGRVYTHGTLSAVRRRSDRAGTAQRLPSTEHLLECCGTYCARQRVVTRSGGARPSWGPLPGLPWSQRPLQEDQSRYAENANLLRCQHKVRCFTNHITHRAMQVVQNAERPDP